MLQKLFLDAQECEFCKRAEHLCSSHELQLDRANLHFYACTLAKSTALKTDSELLCNLNQLREEQAFWGATPADPAVKKLDRIFQMANGIDAFIYEFVSAVSDFLGVDIWSETGVMFPSDRSEDEEL